MKTNQTLDAAIIQAYEKELGHPLTEEERKELAEIIEAEEEMEELQERFRELTAHLTAQQKEQMDEVLRERSDN